MSKILKWLGIIEISVGLLLVIICIAGMLSSSLYPESDMHGYGLGLAIFGSGVGGLMAFAGVTCLFKNRWGFIAHLPLIIYSCVSYYVFLFNYA
ncbi:hypothetical protein [Teredinibacter purpureus]|uniref:hypothetical protein n=1 Tax=Teredinibacter purpureus TaxID=2731756 RepID=UPI0013C53AAA|nr:hypothetical protein [Teredinibacter purpureus]